MVSNFLAWTDANTCSHIFYELFWTLNAFWWSQKDALAEVCTHTVWSMTNDTDVTSLCGVYSTCLFPHNPLLGVFPRHVSLESCRSCLSYFYVSVVMYLDKSNLKKEGLIVAQFKGVVHCGRISKHEDLGVTVDITFSIGKQRTMSEWSCFRSSQGLHYSWQSGITTSINVIKIIIKIIIHKHTNRLTSPVIFRFYHFNNTNHHNW